MARANTVNCSFEVAALQAKTSTLRRGVATLWEAATLQSGFLSLNRTSRVAVEQASFTGGLATGQTTTFQALMTFVTTIVGAGILGFPATFARGGWFWSPVVLLLAGFAAVESGCLLDAALHFVELRINRGEKYSFSQAMRYDDLCEAAFGRTGKILAGVLVNMLLLMIGAVFTILISKNINFLVGFSQEYALFGTAAVFAPLSLLDDMTVIAKLSGVGVVASVIYALAIGIAGLQASSFPGEREYTLFLPAAELSKLGAVISVMLTGFTYQMVAPTVRAEMQKPHELPKAIAGAVALVTLVYLAAGSIAYWGWGNKVEDLIVDSMVSPDGQQMPAGLVLAGAVVANLFVTFPIIMNCVYRAAEAALSVKYSVAIRIALCTSSLLIGRYLPYFLPVLTLVGATVGVVVPLILPVVLYWVLAAGEGTYPRQNKGKFAKHIVLLSFGLFAFFFGTQSAVQDLMKEISG